MSAGDDALAVVREATPEDLSFVSALCRSVFLVYGSYDRYVEDWFRLDGVSTLVAEVEGSRAGFSMLALSDAAEPASGVAELLAIAVAPSLQSRGVGKALLAGALSRAQSGSLDVREVRLSVAESNVRAQRMFARSGFRIEPASGLYPAGQRALFMIKTLGREDPR